MFKESIFRKENKGNLMKLQLLMASVVKTHGNDYPEILEVLNVFENMKKKVMAAGAEYPDLREEFIQFRKITNNYKIPEGVNDKYATIYKALSEIDKNIQA